MRRLPFLFPEVALISLERHTDARGSFAELWRADRFAALGIDVRFIQDNGSISCRNTLRGLHYQHPTPQAKLVTVLSGSVFDVVVDIRRSSPTFGQWAATELSGETTLFVPRGFAHGFLVTSEAAVVLYKVDAPYVSEADHTLRWDDPDLAIPWPIPAGATPVLSPRDGAGRRFRDLVELPP